MQRNHKRVNIFDGTSFVASSFSLCIYFFFHFLLSIAVYHDSVSNRSFDCKIKRNRHKITSEPDLWNVRSIANVVPTWLSSEVNLPFQLTSHMEENSVCIFIFKHSNSCGLVIFLFFFFNEQKWNKINLKSVTIAFAYVRTSNIIYVFMVDFAVESMLGGQSMPCWERCATQCTMHKMQPENHTNNTIWELT